MKIVIDARESGTSTGRYIDKLIEYLHKLQPNHQLIIMTKPERIDFFKELSPGFETVATPYKEFTFGEQIGFKRQIDRLQPDLVHFGMPQQPVRYKGRVITTMHDLTTLRFVNPSKNKLVFKLKQFVYGWVIKKAVHKSKRVIAISKYTSKDVQVYTGENAKKFRVIYEAADSIPGQSVAPSMHAQLDSGFIMYVGRPQPHKNLPRLIEAFAKAKERNSNLKLVLIGKKDTVYQQLEKHAKNLGVDGVIFTGFMPDAEVKWLYENAIAYVVPSLSEGFGLPGLEAMAHNCPVLSSNATCLPEIHADAALYFDPEDTDDMADKISLIIEHETLADELRAKGKQVLARYSWEKTARETLAVYEEALQEQ